MAASAALFVAAAIAFSSATAIAAAAAPDAAAGPQVRVAGGTLSGASSEGIAAFEGIPYAAPPVGERRWRAPAPPAAWAGIRRADAFGPRCMQPDALRFVSPNGSAATTSEDCLTLNVWAPVAHSAPLPVMVWLHGGANRLGTAAITYYDGTSFAHDGVVLVSLNYRLGVFGFFAHRALGNDDVANFGLLDQLAALRWVRANIAAFGGDPANVTLFGESAGGEDTLALASSRAADGLFRRVIVESASDIWEPWPTLAEADARGAKVATERGLPGADATAAQLRALPAADLERATEDVPAGPVVDGRLVTADPARASARSIRVPLLIGTNGGDGSLLGDVATRPRSSRTCKRPISR